MNIDFEKERQEFEQFRAQTFNHTSMIHEPTFQGFLENKITLARYDEMKAKATSDCPHCHGNGYLPVFLPGDNIFVPCVCVDQGPRSSQALAMIQGMKVAPKPLPVRFVRAQTRWGRFINWLTEVT